MSSNKCFVIVAGGTGGHVMPAIAVAETLKESGFSIHWLGTQKGIEARIVPPLGIPLHFIPVQGLRGKGFKSWLLAPFQILRALIEALKILNTLKPCGVLSMGGYVTGPAGLAAWILRIPLILHEQNSISGLTNRLLAPFAKRILLGFPKTFTQSKAHVTGNPIRKSILQALPKTMRNTSDPLRILIIGGSLGAHFFNQIVPKALKLCSRAFAFEVWHQTGEKEFVETQLRYEEINSVRVEPFIENMGEAYVWADLVICRSGALTISELAAIGVPSILIPFPHAVDDHQSYNARYLVDANAAILLPQSLLTPECLSKTIKQLAQDRQKLSLMADKCRSVAQIQATEQVAKNCIEVSCGISPSL
ncbi:MAG TPA: undecaprenyldiphospho-muramoylpentapeptide beta-N-acetylglucosaminyltransferase [Gammaproteobacteria bacterium]|nr:undecaprenyldiphospho-muramoylpentapeptide beta-N-acetylglucosaminyltransferase [Gammaproteobacteria bacterium]